MLSLFYAVNKGPSGSEKFLAYVLIAFFPERKPGDDLAAALDRQVRPLRLRPDAPLDIFGRNSLIMAGSLEG